MGQYLFVVDKTLTHRFQRRASVQHLCIKDVIRNLNDKNISPQPWYYGLVNVLVGWEFVWPSQPIPVR